MRSRSARFGWMLVPAARRCSKSQQTAAGSNSSRSSTTLFITYIARNHIFPLVRKQDPSLRSNLALAKRAKPRNEHKPETLPGVRDDASGLAWDPSGAWWLVADHPLSAVKYDLNFSRVLQAVSLTGVLDPEGRPAGMARIKLAGLVRYPNKGIEGIAYDTTSSDFFIAQEDFPQAVYRLSPDGSFEGRSKRIESQNGQIGQSDVMEWRCGTYGRHEGMAAMCERLEGVVEGVALSGDGRLLAVASEPNTFSLYSAGSCG
ncbi:hypothetical protein VOLCADRAFT_108016 [Volvox carteri f. nagariensis]|uniref:Uncharacterized protein n=1 Tax=Volvox carteri f. nagariensis TaxID=3068 RepID=D8UHR8_VOLCA|nr:uncharacterized protein VOLCADRAFT_108016 [Volvox carteri f. nagariensis]EFJ40729.1 hypothetical protein VOLCADRAFT_108016 [Volvox carteri f. nagariensis]|eukprot:XP_002958195.1 hypothetical protein VOLCADRAFT_108016 [Volvox carteri f. nagariensis]